jgi:hypothetical protein
MGSLVFQATLGGQVNLNGPNTASTFDIAVPATTGTMVTTGDTGTVTNTMLAGSIANAKLTSSSVTVGSTSIALGATSTTLDGVNIGATTPGTGAFTTLSGTTSVTTPIVKSASSLTLQSNGTTTAVTVDTSQNVGIGTASPSNRLQAYDASAKAAVLANGYSVVGANANAVNGSIQVGSTTSAALFLDIDGITGGTATASIYNTYAGVLRFGTSNTERMRIDSSGTAMFNTTSQLIRSSETFRVSGGTGGVASFKTNNSGTPTIAVQNTNGVTVYVMAFSNSAGEVGTISTNTGVTLYNTTSDYRLKENVVPMTGALAKIAALKPVTYKWKSDGADGEGFIAHELAEVFPVAVTGAKDAVDEEGNPRYQGIDTSQLIATLTAAIQELTARIAALEAK